MKLCILAFACGRDAELLPPWLTHIHRTYPGATIILANDEGDPIDPGTLPIIPSSWSTAGAVATVPDALVTAIVVAKGCTHLIKTDLDTVHLKSDWLQPLTTGAQVVGFINPIFPVVFQGPAYALSRAAAFRAAIQCRSSLQRTVEEDVAMSLLTRLACPNSVHLHPHAPRHGGPFSHWNPAGCRDPHIYRDLFNVVHCGTIPRAEVPPLMAAML